MSATESRRCRMQGMVEVRGCSARGSRIFSSTSAALRRPISPSGLSTLEMAGEKASTILRLSYPNREISRRIIDFLSGVAYANNGNIRNVAKNTFIIVPTDVDVMGELIPEDFDESGNLYF